jgi:hypothetical protein
MVMKPDVEMINAVTGMRVRVLQTPEETGGRAVVIEYRLRPHTGRGYTRPHGHRRYVERFDILAGRAGAIVGGVEMTAEAGETLAIPLDTLHVHPWSISDEELVVRQTTEAVTPDVVGLRNALRSADILFDLARQGKVNANGEANPLRMAVIFNDLLLPQSYAAGLPYGLQRVVFGILAGVGRLAGYRLPGEPVEASHTPRPV